MSRMQTVKDVKQQLDDLCDKCDDMPIAFILEKGGELLIREIYIPSMSTVVREGSVEVWLLEPKTPRAVESLELEYEELED